MKLRLSAYRIALFAIAPVLLFIALLAAGPIVQPDRYHEFAGAQRLLGVDNFWNVVSNLPFLLVGIYGFRLSFLKTIEMRRAWLAVFASAVLVFFGSSWYHLAPDDARLVWDRVPIALAFMALFAVLVGESVHEKLGNALLLPAMFFGVASVFWWRATGNLAPYIWVQAAPILMILLAPREGKRYLLYALACYVLAKLAEVRDAEIYAWTGEAVSGHVLKHLLAAAGVACFYYMLAAGPRAPHRPTMDLNRDRVRIQAQAVLPPEPK